MELDSVRALKREVLESIIVPAIENVRHASAFSVAAKSMNRTTRVVPAVALGITKGKTQRDFRLAVRVQQRPIDSDGSLQDGIRRLAGGE